MPHTLEAGISSKSADGLEVPRGPSHGICEVAGAKAVRVIEHPETSVNEHAHDWPVLSLYVMGACMRLFDGTAVPVAGPCAVLHPAGAYHSSTVGVLGLEQIDIEFDPTWLCLDELDILQRAQHWRGGRIGQAATRLAKLWSWHGAAEVGQQAATREFILRASAVEAPPEPNWLRTVAERMDSDSPPTTLELAQDVSLHPAWLTQAYRLATGEGLQQALMRKRIERAAILLRTRDDPAAGIALEAGFCDQSHMIRCFRHLLGRTPSEVRAEQAPRARAALAA